MRTSQNLIFHTFIGLEAEIIKSADRKLIGLKGKIIDETKNLIVIERESDSKEIKIPKISSAFKFFLESGESTIIEGKSIIFRPEERAKKLS